MLMKKEPEAVPVWALLRISLLGIQNHMIVNLRGHGYLANVGRRVLADNDIRGVRSCAHHEGRVRS